MMDKKIPSEKARQGRNGPRVLIVLVAALALAMAAWWGAEIYGQMIEADRTAASYSGD